MRWTPGGVSGDIEDRRDSSGGGGFGFGGGGVPFGIGGLLVLLVLSFIFKRDLISPFLNSGSPGGAATISRPEDPARKAAGTNQRPRLKTDSYLARLIRATLGRALSRRDL